MKTVCGKCGKWYSMNVSGYAVFHPEEDTYCPQCVAVTNQAKIAKKPLPGTICADTTLYFQNGESDKVYRAWIERAHFANSGETYRLYAEYGRRGQNMTQTTKVSAGGYEYCYAEFQKLIKDKQKKGYSTESKFSDPNGKAATPNQIAQLKIHLGGAVPPGITKEQAAHMLDKLDNAKVDQIMQQDKQSAYQKKMQQMIDNKKTWQEQAKPMKPLGMLPLKKVPIPPKIEPSPKLPVPKSEPAVIPTGPTGRRIKEID